MSTDALVFDCKGDALVGVLHRASVASQRGAVIVVGGPQYRVGSHRQFYHSACALAAAGVPALRFDYRGMGDSEGAARDFEAVDDDIRAAVDTLIDRVDSVREVVLIGLCDAASAILMYAHKDARVAGVALMNPWVRSEASLARTTVRHYYLRRLVSREFWSKLLHGDVDWRASLVSLKRILRSASGDRNGTAADESPFQARMLAGAQAFDGPVLLVTSGDDMTAAEFLDLEKADRAWQRVLARDGTTRHAVPDANHTFSSHDWRSQVDDHLTRWVHSW